MKRAHPTNLFDSIIHTLSNRQEEYLQQESRLTQFLAILRANIPGTITYRVHIREGGLGRHGIMGPTSTRLSNARKKAIRLWQEHNARLAEPHVEAFVITGGMIVPLTPAEAVAIAHSEDKKTHHKESLFMFNDELLGSIGETVRLAKTKLPGWYEEQETKSTFRKK